MLLGICLFNFLNSLTAAPAFAVLHIGTIKLRQVYLRAAMEIRVVAERSCAIIATTAEDSQLGASSALYGIAELEIALAVMLSMM
jgi:hypothetical protein